jgi:hypothetical protein
MALAFGFAAPALGFVRTLAFAFLVPAFGFARPFAFGFVARVRARGFAIPSHATRARHVPPPPSHSTRIARSPSPCASA